VFTLPRPAAVLAAPLGLLAAHFVTRALPLPPWTVPKSSDRGLRRSPPGPSVLTLAPKFRRDVERDLIPMARAFDLAVTPWGVLGAGLLTGKYAGGKAPEDTRRAGWTANKLTEKNLNTADEVQKIATELGASSSQVAIAWVRAKAPCVIPLIGARTHEQLLDNLESVKVTLSAEQMKRLDTASAISLGFPHEFLSERLDPQHRLRRDLSA
jgi:hypothetical protein